MSVTQEIHVLGTTLRVRSQGNPDELEYAAEEVEQYVQSIQTATRMADTRQLLLVALLNQTMEMRRMQKKQETTGGTGSLVNWATELTNSIREALD